MAKVIGSEDCGNSPKNQFAQDLAIALETGDFSDVMLSQDAVWQRQDSAAISGSDAIQKICAQYPKATSIHINHAISHGKIGMANGETTLSDGSLRRFCHVLEFTNTKGNRLAVIYSYA